VGRHARMMAGLRLGRQVPRYFASSAGCRSSPAA
jgi:hypothetical protein